MAPLVPYLLLPLVGALGGALNAVAGGGSFLVFPALVFVRVPPREANATTAVALWTASWATFGGYRKALGGSSRVLVPLAFASTIGGLAGAVLLLRTSAEAFQRILPWLLLVGTLIFAVGPVVTKRLPRVEHPGFTRLAVGFVAQLLIATYGGYFGGGMGILMLATLSLMGMTDLSKMNAVKVTLTLFINGIASLAFVWNGIVDWRSAALVASGGVVGGFFGARLAMRVDARFLRGFVIVVGAVLTVYFFGR